MKANICVHHIALQTANLDKAIDFYVNIIGLELIKRYPFKKREMAWLKAGNIVLEIFSKRYSETLSETLMEWNDFHSGPVHIAFIVKDFNAFLKEALSKGAEFHPSHPEIFTPPINNAKPIAYLLGPDGEKVEIRYDTTI